MDQPSDFLLAIEELEARLERVPGDLDLQEQLVEALVVRRIYGYYEEDRAVEQTQQDDRRVNELLEHLPQDRAYYSRAFVAYMESKDEVAAQWIGRWAERISRCEPPFDHEHLVYTLLVPFEQTPAEFWWSDLGLYLDSLLGVSLLSKGDCPMSKRPEIPESGRFSAKRKMEAVVRLLRGEDLELVSREYGVVAGLMKNRLLRAFFPVTTLPVFVPLPGT